MQDGNRGMLDDAMGKLSVADRNALLLRFFKDKTLREVGKQLGLSEDAARMRVARAMGRLRELLVQQGIKATTAALAVAVSSNAICAVPSGLVASIASASLAGTATATTSTTITILKLMTMTKLKLSAISTLIIAAVAVPVWQGIQLHRANGEKSQIEAQLAELPALRQEVQRLSSVEADRAELDRLRDLKTQTQGELAELRARLQRSEAQAALIRSQMESRLSTLPGNKTAKQRSVIGRAMMEGQAMGKALEQMPRLRAKLNLTPGQEEAVQELMRKRAQRLNLLMEVGTNGTPRIRSASREHEKELNEIMEGSVFGDIGEQIRSLLSPEQQTAYQELLQEDATRNASDELTRLQETLGLTEEQRKKVFTILYYNVLQLLGPSPNDSSVETWITQLIEQRMKELQDVLTPVQMNTYRQHSPSPKAQ